MSDKTKSLQPKLKLNQTLRQLDAKAVLELIRPTERTFMCQRYGNLVDGGYCGLYCEIGKDLVVYNPTVGIEVVCPFAFNSFLGRMGNDVMTDS